MSDSGEDLSISEWNYLLDAPRRVVGDTGRALLAAHRLWGEWLVSGRVHKIAFVAERTRV